MPNYIVSLENAILTADSERRLMEFFEMKLKGVGNSHRSLFIPLISDDPDKQPKLNFEAVEQGNIDSDFNNYRAANRDEILMSQRVPINKLGLASGVSLAAGRDASKSFKEEVCRPDQARLNKKVGKIFKEMQDTLDFKLNELTLTDEDIQSRVDERLVKTQVKTANEVRATLGLPSVDWGDEPLPLTGQLQAENRAQGNRERDAQRSAGATDSIGEGRNTQGEGRTVA